MTFALIPLAILILGIAHLMATRRIVKAGRVAALRERRQHGSAMRDAHQPRGSFPIVETRFHGAQ